MTTPALISLRSQWTEAVVRVAASLGLAIDYSLTFISLRPECQGRDGILPRALIFDAGMVPMRAEDEDTGGPFWRGVRTFAAGESVEDEAFQLRAVEESSAQMKAFMAKWLAEV